MNKLILGAATAALMATSSANAAFIMYLDDLSTSGDADIIVQDDTLAGLMTSIGLTTDADAQAIEGIVSYAGVISGFTFNVAIGSSDPVNTAPGTIFDLVSLTIGGAGDIEIGLTDTSFTGDQNFTFQIGGTTDGSVTAQAYLDVNNTEFGQGILLGDMSTTGTGAFAYSSATSYLNDLVNPYSLSLVTAIHHQVGDTTSFDAAVNVPEPSMIALMSLGLIGLGAASRRRQV